MDWQNHQVRVWSGNEVMRHHGRKIDDGAWSQVVSDRVVSHPDNGLPRPFQHINNAWCGMDVMGLFAGPSWNAQHL